MAAAQHLINNPMVSAAAVQYGSEFAQQGQAYVNKGVSPQHSLYVCTW